jgi:hypothetical protein
MRSFNLSALAVRERVAFFITRPMISDQPAAPAPVRERLVIGAVIRESTARVLSTSTRRESLPVLPL